MSCDICNPPDLLQESLRPFGPEVSRECPSGCLQGPSGPGSGVSKKCPESLPGVSKRYPRHSGDTLGTLFGHSGAPGPEGPRRHREGHSRDTSGPKGPRDSCSRSGGCNATFQNGGSILKITMSIDAIPTKISFATEGLGKNTLRCSSP